jgi:hypothetical protein
VSVKRNKKESKVKCFETSLLFSVLNISSSLRAKFVYRNRKESASRNSESVSRSWEEKCGSRSWETKVCLWKLGKESVSLDVGKEIVSLESRKKIVSLEVGK